MIIRNDTNGKEEDSVNLLEYILSITHDRTLLFPQELSGDTNYYINNKTITNNNTRFSLSAQIDKFISYFPTSIIQLFVIIFLICFILSICKCYKFLDLLRQHRKIDRENSQNSSYSSSSNSNYVHYRDESSSFKDNCCCYWLSKRYYCLRRFKRRLMGFRKKNQFYNNEKTRRGKRRFNNKQKSNPINNEDDSVIFRRKSIVYRCNKTNNNRRKTSCAPNLNYNNNIARNSVSRYLQTRSVRQLN